MKFNKRGMASEMFAPDTIIFWLIFGVILGFVAMFFVLIVSKAGSEQARINENLESLNLVQRFFKSPECFIYSKEGISMTRVIDAGKFTEENLNRCYKINENLFPAFRITLSSDSAKISKSIKTNNWNDNRESEERYWKTQRDIFVYSQDRLYKGSILIDIQNVQ